MEVDGFNPKTEEMEEHWFDIDEQWAVMNKRAASKNDFVEAHFRSDKLSDKGNKVFSYEDLVKMIETALTPN